MGCDAPAALPSRLRRRTHRQRPRTPAGDQTTDAWRPVIFDTAHTALAALTPTQEPPAAYALAQDAATWAARAIDLIDQHHPDRINALTEALARLLATDRSPCSRASRYPGVSGRRRGAPVHERRRLACPTGVPYDAPVRDFNSDGSTATTTSTGRSSPAPRNRCTPRRRSRSPRRRARRSGRGIGRINCLLRPSASSCRVGQPS